MLGTHFFHLPTWKVLNEIPVAVNSTAPYQLLSFSDMATPSVTCDALHTMLTPSANPSPPSPLCPPPLLSSHINSTATHTLPAHLHLGRPHWRRSWAAAGRRARCTPDDSCLPVPPGSRRPSDRPPPWPCGRLTSSTPAAAALPQSIAASNRHGPWTISLCEAAASSQSAAANKRHASWTVSLCEASSCSMVSKHCCKQQTWPMNSHWWTISLCEASSCSTASKHCCKQKTWPLN